MRPAGSARPVRRSSRRPRPPRGGGDNDADGEAAYANLNLPGAFEDDDGGAGADETCANCRFARVRCTKAYPCSRCFRLCLQCRPQLRQGRKGNAEEGGSDVVNPGAALLAALDAHPLQHRLLDVVFQRSNPRALAHVYVQAVMELQCGGLLDRAMVAETGRWWWLQSAAAGGDASWGFLGTVAAALGFSAVDFEPPDWLARAPPGAQRQQEARALLEAAVGQMAELERASPLRHAEDGVSALAVGLPVDRPPGYCEASNSVFKALWRGMDELLGDDLARHRTLGALLMLSLVGPDDRLQFARVMMTRLMTRQTHPLSTIIKVFNRQGEIKLYLLQVRPARRLPPDGRPSGFLFRAEECPPSRHVTAAPGHAFTAATFRQISRQPPALAAAATAAAVAENGTGGGRGGDGAPAAQIPGAVLPGVAALQFPPLPSSLTPEDEVSLVADMGPRVFPPLPHLPQGPACPVGPSPAETGEADDDVDGAQDANGSHHGEASLASSGSSFPFPLPPNLDMDDDDRALLGRLFA